MSTAPKVCVRCGVEFVETVVECPQGEPGCLVLHYGERCPKCGGRVYE